jgi:hypothetical protein
MDAGPPEIGVHEEDPAARLGERDSQVARGHRLAFIRARAGHEERPDRSVDRGELDVRAKAAIALGDT